MRLVYRTFAPLLLLLSVCSTQHCHNGWLPHNNSCYLIVRQPETFSSAQSTCKSVLKGTLAEIGDASENNFLKNTIVRLYGYDGNYWIGGTDLSAEGEWEWISNEEGFDFTDWIPGQPDNTGLQENCLELDGGKYHLQWNDYVCTAKHYYICERGYLILISGMLQMKFERDKIEAKQKDT